MYCRYKIPAQPIAKCSLYAEIMFLAVDTGFGNFAIRTTYYLGLVLDVQIRCHTHEISARCVGLR